jgi:hypothetical protein
MVAASSSQFPQSAGKRSKVSLDANLDKKLNDYEVAGSSHAFTQIAAGVATVTLTGIGILSFAHAAEAEVIFTPTHQSMRGPRGFFPIDFNADGVPDVGVALYSSFDLSSGFKGVQILSAYGLQTGNEIAVTKKGFAGLGVGGEELGSSANFMNHGLMAEQRWDSRGSSHKGQWQNVASRHFLGVKFLINGQTHFGWLRFSMANAGAATLTGYAYESIADKPIIAGLGNGGKMLPATHPQHPAGTLGRLAAGVAGHTH